MQQGCISAIFYYFCKTRKVKYLNMIPETFEAWQSCIVNDCKISLTKDYVMSRLAIYQDMKNKETQKFVSLYGQEHLQNIVYWLNKIAEED